MALAGVAVERLVGVGGGWRRGVVGVVAGIEGAAAGLEAGLAGHLDGDPAQHHRPHPSLSRCSSPESRSGACAGTKRTLRGSRLAGRRDA
jgi:hypothetical protein